MTTNPFPLGREVEPDHDPRSFAFPAVSPADSVQIVDRQWRQYGPILDQGNLGSCTGNAIVGALNHKPLHKVGERTFRQEEAREVYSIATRNDPWAGEWPPTDTGSSGLAACKAAKILGYINEYRWAFGVGEVLAALMEGPVAVGTVWYSGMFYPSPSGLLTVSGSVAGGHEYVIDGWRQRDHLFVGRNSWGKGWAVNGRFFLKYDDLDRLLREGGDAVVPGRRIA